MFQAMVFIEQLDFYVGNWCICQVIDEVDVEVGLCQ